MNVYAGLDVALRETATVAVSRKLAVIMHRMWLDGSDFRWSRDGATAAPVPVVQ